MVCLDSSVHAPEKQVMKLDCREIESQFSEEGKTAHCITEAPQFKAQLCGIFKWC